MIPKLVIEKKRDGLALDGEEIGEFVRGFTAGDIPDCQASALAMAICCRGMDARETADLVKAMLDSGESIEWEKGLPVADKHSTGGVGDKLSLIIQPVAAACGLYVPSLVGRGLGLTGGTADKLEAIPGYKTSVSLERFKEITLEAGLSMATQTEEIAPADRKLYALRDITGTVASIPLIVSSILSKKLAEGAGTLVFDVKCGSGAFMKTEEEACELAQALVDGAKASGRAAAALVTSMSAPLGRAVGNACEVEEALAILRGSFRDASGAILPDVALSLELAAMMVSLSKDVPIDEARAECLTKLESGAALAKFEAMVEAHGGSIGAFERARSRPRAKFVIQAARHGYVESIDARKTAEVALSLGAGRLKPGDRLDLDAGIVFAVRPGDKVSSGSPLATLECSGSPDGLEDAAGALLGAFTFSREPLEPRNLVLRQIS